MNVLPPTDSRPSPESAMDRVVETACALFRMPMGLVSILGDDELRFRSLIGLDDASVPPQLSVTRMMVEMGAGAVLVIPNTLDDPRVREHPLVVGELAVRYVAAATVTLATGQPVGLICVLDRRPRDGLSDRETEALKRMARMAGDILDRNQAERRQNEQLGKLKLAEALAGVGHWRLDLTTRELQWSEETYRIHGMVPGEFALSPDEVVALYDSADRSTIAGVFDGAIPPGDSYLARVLGPDGAPRKTRSSAKLEHDEDGRVTAIFGVVRDITAREAERAALVRSEANYRLLADNLGDVIARVSASGLIDYVSPAVETLLGYEVESVIGSSARSFIHPDDWRTVRNLTARSVAGAFSERIQHRVLHRNGQEIWVESHCRPLPHHEAVGPTIVLTLSDVSERKRLEQEWIAARDRAEAADRAKSEFLANMSHELRTPLTSVIGFSGLLQASTGLSDEQERHVDRIATASKALLGVINDILDYSKLEAGGVSLDERPFAVRGLIEGAAAIIESPRGDRCIGLVVCCDPAIPARLVGDEARLRQVLLNFLSNAMKFTARGEIRLEGVMSGERLRVSVTDTGIGIAPEKLGTLFDRFSQADASTTRLYGGTGLGLSISRKLIELMGGSIGVSSEVGRGSTFWFDVPLRAADDAVVEIADHAAPAAVGGLRVLVADDVAANRELVSAILTSLGATVDTAVDGAHAVDAVQSATYDVILMDMHMPVLDGLGATRAIRGLPGASSAVPIIALTANVQADHIRRCYEAGMDGHVGKPIVIVELIQSIEHAILGMESPGARIRTGPLAPQPHRTKLGLS